MSQNQTNQERLAQVNEELRGLERRQNDLLDRMGELDAEKQRLQRDKGDN